MSIPKCGIYIPKFETEIWYKESAFFLKQQMIIELSLMFSLFIRMIISFEDLDGMVFVEDDPGGEFLLQTEFLAGFVP